ncbi:MAG: O-antigen ligase family protein, partial [Bosea sp. (in: a-proteobacteria)]
MQTEQPPLAVYFERLAFALLALMPLVMWAANRSAPLMLALASLAMLTAAVADGRLGWMQANIGQALRRPVGIALLLFLAFAMISISWSHRPLASLFALGEALLPVICGLVLASAWPNTMPRWAAPALGCSIIAACLLVLAEISNGNAWRLALGLRPDGAIFNRTLLVCLLLAVPVVATLARGPNLAVRLLAPGVAAAVSTAILSSESGAAKLGLAGVLATWAIALLVPRLMLILAATGFIVALACAPIMGEVAEVTIPASTHAQLKDSHSRDRVDIWLSFGEAIRARPLTGAGFGTSGTMDKHPVASEVPANRRILLGSGHPHSATVQVWAETGLPGALLLLCAGLGLVPALAQLARTMLAPHLALIAGALSVAMVGHGAWQGWWIAGLAAAACWLRS